MGNNKTQKRKVQITSIITLFVFLFDIYLIIYVPTDYILATAAFVTLVFTIITLGSWFKLKDMEAQRREEQYADIMKAEKGTYVVTLDMMKQLDDKINFIGQKIMPLGKAGDVNQRKIASMLDGIVEDQKKIAKITISRSKENADALMNSNDQLLVQMEEFRNSIELIKEQVSKQPQISGDENIGEIKNELFEKMQELTESIKKEVDEISENIESSSHAVEDLVSKKLDNSVTEEPVKPEEIQPEEIQPEEIQTEEPAIPEAIEIDGDDIISELIMEKKSLDEAVLSEEVPMEESLPEPEPDPNKPMSPEDIEALLASTGVGGSSEDVNEPEVEKVIEAPVEEAPVEEAPPMPDMTDPNKPMSPEDIAALIANSAAEDLPDETVRFEEEEAPPMPDMTDPNKMMSADDIAALIANM